MYMKTDKSPSPWTKRTNGKSQEHLPGPGHPATTPDIRPLEHPPQQPPSRSTSTGPGHLALARKSGQKPGHPAPRTRTYRSCLHQPGHPALREGPDIRPRLSAHSKGPKPVYPFAPLDYIYSPISLFLGLAFV
ncbi:hypothetical protein VPH35_036783 [Triticum aestivum]